MKIRIDAEFTAKTAVAYNTYCTAHHWVFSDFRDVDAVEHAVAFAKKVLNSKAYRDKVITFSYEKAPDTYDYRGTSRICDNFGDGFRELTWDVEGRLVNEVKHEKFPAKRIKELYLECVEIASENERRNGAVD